VVRSTLVNMCQVMGCLRTAHVHRGPWIYETGETLPEEDQVAVILGSLSAGPDPLTRLKGFLCLATYHIERGDVSGFEGFLAQAGRVVAENVVALGLDEDQLFSEHSGSSDAEDLAPHGLLNESRAALSQLVWTDIVRSLVLRRPLLNGAVLSKFTRMAVRGFSSPVYLPISSYYSSARERDVHGRRLHARQERCLPRGKPSARRRVEHIAI
jgi:hypothetical protein